MRGDPAVVLNQEQLGKNSPTLILNELMHLKDTARKKGIDCLIADMDFGYNPRLS